MQSFTKQWLDSAPVGAVVFFDGGVEGRLGRRQIPICSLLPYIYSSSRTRLGQAIFIFVAHMLS